jgi:hypothetical protein
VRWKDSAISSHEFVQDGISVSVEAPAADLIWLREFLEPAFAVQQTGQGDVSVCFEATSDVPAIGEPDQVLTVFTLDSRAIRLPASPIPGGSRIHDASRGLTIDVTAEGRSARLRYHADVRTARFALMRVVREYAHNHSVLSGGLILHAAAVTVGDAAIAIAGVKGVGKTTLALDLLMEPGSGYLSNDRVLVRSGTEPRAIAVPSVVSLRPSTRPLMPALAEYLQRCGDFREHTGERDARGPGPPVMSGDSWNISPWQLAKALDRPLQASAPLTAVIFPTDGITATEPLRRLTPVAASQALSDARLCRLQGSYVSDVFVASRGGVPDEARLQTSCESLASTVACFAVPPRSRLGLWARKLVPA